MASIRDLKKDINYVLGDIIEAVYMWELSNPEKDTKKSQEIVEEAITYFDELTEKVNQKEVLNKKKHFKEISAELEAKGNKLIEKLNSL